MDIFKLVGSVMVETADAENSLSKVDNKAEGTGKKLSSMAGTVGKAALGIGAAMAGAGAAAFKMASDSAAAADAIDKGSIRMGVSTESFQKLQYAAGQSGVEMSTLEKAAKKLEGTDLSFDDAIAQVMSLGTETERSAKAAELFGDSVAYQLSPILAMSGDDFQNLQDRASELGIVMSEDAVAAGVKMGDTMSDVKQALGAVGTQIGSEMMPIIQKLLDWILAHMPEIQKIVGGVVSFVTDLVKSLIPVIEALTPVIDGVFKLVGTLWEGSLKPILTGITDFLNGVFTGDWKKAFEGLSTIVSGVFNGLGAIVKAPLNGIIDIINRFIGNLGSISIPDWIPGIGGKSLSMPQIPHLAKGGILSDYGTVMVGEAGPELLTLPQGASITPLSGNGGDVGKKLDAILDVLKNMNVGSDIVLDTGILVGQTVSAYDKALGNRQTLRARGV